MDAKGNVTLVIWNLELQMLENSTKPEEVGNNCLVPENLPLPVVWCWLWRHTRQSFQGHPFTWKFWDWDCLFFFFLFFFQSHSIRFHYNAFR